MWCYVKLTAFTIILLIVGAIQLNNSTNLRIQANQGHRKPSYKDFMFVKNEALK